MQDILNAILLGVVQGATEFLPISSSGHLAILHELRDFDLGSNLFFDIVLHLATLLAVIIFYRNKIKDLIIAFFFSIKTLFQGKGVKASFWHTEDTKLNTLIILGSIPTMILGLGIKDYIEDFGKDMKIVGVGLCITALMLLLFELKKHTYKNIKTMSIWDGLIIGFAQGCAIMPGISRSGSTIATAKLLNIKKDTAANFSFLLSLPAVAGAFLLEAKDVEYSAISGNIMIYVIGFIVSFLSGYLCLSMLIWLIKHSNFKAFFLYTLGLGLTMIFWIN